MAVIYYRNLHHQARQYQKSEVYNVKLPDDLMDCLLFALLTVPVHLLRVFITCKSQLINMYTSDHKQCSSLADHALCENYS